MIGHCRAIHMSHAASSRLKSSWTGSLDEGAPAKTPTCHRAEQTIERHCWDGEFEADRRGGLTAPRRGGLEITTFKLSVANWRWLGLDKGG